MLPLCSKCKLNPRRTGGSPWCNTCRGECARANYAKKAATTRDVPCIKCGGDGPFMRGMKRVCKACESAARKLAYAANTGGFADRARAASREMPQRARKDNSLRYHYGITIDDFDALLKSQNGLCAICECRLTSPHVDHCHKSGQVRGLLCSPCNKGLGHFKDDPLVIRRALAYLTKLRVAPAKKEGCEDA